MPVKDVDDPDVLGTVGVTGRLTSLLNNAMLSRCAMYSESA
jgi:hypothetical protein